MKLNITASSLLNIDYFEDYKYDLNLWKREDRLDKIYELDVIVNPWEWITKAPG
jgi:hypothetical protein